MMMLSYVYMLRKIEIKINKLEGMIKELCIKKKCTYSLRFRKKFIPK